MLGAALACSASSAVRAQTAFYQLADQAELNGPAGSLIRREKMSFTPNGVDAYRLLYRSTGLHGEPIAVSAMLLVPQGAPPPGGRKIIAWAHPTTGVVPRCAPSLPPVQFGQIQGLDDMIARGYAVVATDYPGLGTSGPHPYLVGDSEAKAVLDSVRAARSQPEVGGGARFAVWGHSQGGQAALFTGLLAKSYAPELDLVGVAAAAPATDLDALLVADLNTVSGKNLTSMTLWSWSRIFDAPLAPLVAPAAVPTIDQLAGECIESLVDLFERAETEKPLEQNFLITQNLAGVEPWGRELKLNSPGVLPAAIPVFLAQGAQDKIVRPQVTKNYMDQLCRAGSRVALLSLPQSGHAYAGRDAAPDAVAWMADRFSGAPAPTSCGE